MVIISAELYPPHQFDDLGHFKVTIKSIVKVKVQVVFPPLALVSFSFAWLLLAQTRHERSFLVGQFGIGLNGIIHLFGMHQ